jgi:hypothetical protein
MGKVKLDRDRLFYWSSQRGMVCSLFLKFTSDPLCWSILGDYCFIGNTSANAAVDHEIHFPSLFRECLYIGVYVFVVQTQKLLILWSMGFCLSVSPSVT